MPLSSDVPVVRHERPSARTVGRVQPQMVSQHPQPRPLHPSGLWVDRWVTLGPALSTDDWYLPPAEYLHTHGARVVHLTWDVVAVNTESGVYPVRLRLASL